MTREPGERARTLARHVPAEPERSGGETQRPEARRLCVLKWGISRSDQTRGRRCGYQFRYGVLCDDYFFTMHAAARGGAAIPATGSSTLARGRDFLIRL